jgi:hypothetical protein
VYFLEGRNGQQGDSAASTNPEKLFVRPQLILMTTIVGDSTSSRAQDEI